MQATHSVSFQGKTEFVDESNYNAVVEQFIRENGGKFEGIDIVPIAEQAVRAEVVRGQTIDQAGATRSTLDMLLAKEAGFAPKPPIYARGTMVIEVGVENARLSRVAYEKKPLLAEALSDFQRVIHNEERTDLVLPAGDLRLDKDGNLRGPSVDGQPSRLGYFTRRGLRSLLSRAGIGGHDYLAQLPAELRAINVNWHLGGRVPHAIRDEVKVRTRRCGESREVYAVLSPRYTTFDSDSVAAELSDALVGSDARGSVVYDGEDARFEALWHSNVQPEDYVAGEFFKAGIVVRTSDDGSGSCRVSAVVWQNLCLNLIVIDEAEQEIARVRHVGRPERMAAKLRDAFLAAESKLEGFRKRWGYACRDVLTNRLSPDEQALPIEQVIPGFFNGAIEHELVPVRGKRQDVVRSLADMYRADKSSATQRGFTRAALANAFTRWAHEVNTDTWLEDEVQRAAGKLVQSTQPLPYLPIELEG